MKRNPMTLRGAEALRNELKRLKTEDRPRVIKAIAEARSHGDLSENAEYHAAREQQGFIEGRIGEIEAKLSTAEVIDTASLNNTGKVIFGATVDLEDQDDGKKITYQIVGEDEADIKTGRISITSPIARSHRRQDRGRRRRRGRARRQAQLRSDGSPLRLASQ
jgi:transcription elongation factor GreA